MVKGPECRRDVAGCLLQIADRNKISGPVTLRPHYEFRPLARVARDENFQDFTAERVILRLRYGCYAVSGCVTKLCFVRDLYKDACQRGSQDGSSPSSTYCT